MKYISTKVNNSEFIEFIQEIHDLNKIFSSSPYFSRDKINKILAEGKVIIQVRNTPNPLFINAIVKLNDRVVIDSDVSINRKIVLFSCFTGTKLFSNLNKTDISVFSKASLIIIDINRLNDGWQVNIDIN